MNILFLDQFGDLGGAQRCLVDLLPAILERGWNPHVAAPGGGRLADAVLGLGIPFHPIRYGPYSLGRKSPADALRFLRDAPSLKAGIQALAENCHADLIYVNGPRLLPAARAAEGRRPLLFHIHSHLPKRYASWLVGRASRAASATVVACCRYAAEPIACYVKPERLHVAYNGVAAPPPRSQTRARAGLRIGVVGRIAPEKGQAEFLGAARLLAPMLPAATFVICGDALFDDPAAQRYRERLHRIAAGLPVEFTGWRSDVYCVLAGLDLLVIPSVREPGMPRVLLEAYAAAVPVVAFASGGIPEAMVDGETGFLVSPLTAEALAARIATELRAGAPRLQQVAEAGRVLWRERFTLERYRREMIERIARL